MKDEEKAESKAARASSGGGRGGGSGGLVHKSMTELREMMSKLSARLDVQMQSSPSAEMRSLQSKSVKFFLIAHYSAMRCAAQLRGDSVTAAGASVVLLQWCGIYPADKAFFLAANACKNAGWTNLSYVLAARYLDISDAVEEVSLLVFVFLTVLCLMLSLSLSLSLSLPLSLSSAHPLTLFSPPLFTLHPFPLPPLPPLILCRARTPTRLTTMSSWTQGSPLRQNGKVVCPQRGTLIMKRMRRCATRYFLAPSTRVSMGRRGIGDCRKRFSHATKRACLMRPWQFKSLRRCGAASGFRVLRESTCTCIST